EKRLLLPDRAAQCCAKLILPERGLAGGEEAPRIEGVIADEFVGGSMKFIAAALGHDVDHAARHATELGLVALRLNAELAQRIDVRRQRVRSAIVPVVINAVQGEAVATVGLSVNGREIRLTDPGNKERRVVFRDAYRGCPRRQRDQLRKIPGV